MICTKRVGSHTGGLLRLFLLVGWLCFGLTAAAEARDCGGTKRCRCGDRVVENYRLPGDLGPCPKHGLTVRGPVSLDGGGHVLRGSRTASSSGVILVEDATGARVSNLEITGFERGLRFVGTRGARVEGIESHHNGDPIAHKGYGIDVAHGASDNVIDQVHVHNNADEGIHIGSRARGNRVVNSRVHDNYRENVYFLENEGNSLEGSILSGGGESSVFVKHAKDVRIERNQIGGRGVQVRGDSSSVRLLDNQVNGGGLNLRPYDKDARGKTVPRDVSVVGGSIRADSGCVRLIEARQVRLEGVELDCNPSVELAGKSDLTALDTRIRRVTCRGEGILREERAAEVTFVDTEGRPVAGVEVSGPVRGAAAVALDGVWRGKVLTGTSRCPGPRRTVGPPITLQLGEWSRSLGASEMKGRIVVGESGP